MKNNIKLIQFMLTMLVVSVCFIGCSEKNTSPSLHQSSNTSQLMSKKMVVDIILGSTRQGRSSDKIAQLLKQMADKRSDIITNIIDLRVYNLPFFNDETAPANREKITDPTVQKWSDTIREADAFIIVVPEYNNGYPGVLKNALDSLYKEWNNKPVGFVGYSGGPSGASSALAQLRTVAGAFKMIPVSSDIKIPYSWKAFDAQGNFVNKNIESELDKMIDQMVAKKQ